MPDERPVTCGCCDWKATVATCTPNPTYAPGPDPT